MSCTSTRGAASVIATEWRNEHELDLVATSIVARYLDIIIKIIKIGCMET